MFSPTEPLSGSVASCPADGNNTIIDQATSNVVFFVDDEAISNVDNIGFKEKLSMDTKVTNRDRGVAGGSPFTNPLHFQFNIAISSQDLIGSK